MKRKTETKSYMKPYMPFYGSKKRVNHIRHKRKNKN